MALQKICILGLNDYAMLRGDVSGGHIGGESVQHVLLARAWRDMGLDVSIIVCDSGQPPVVEIDGIRAIAAYRINSGIRGLRFFQRTGSIIRAMTQSDADVYYQSPSGMLAGVAAWFARRHGKRSIVRIASDLGCIPGRQLTRYWRDRKIYEYGLRHADLIAAQTQHQRQLLLQNYGLRSEVVNMLVEAPAPTAAGCKDIDVLWVGNLRPVKKPERVLELARRLPQRRFVIAGGPLPRQESYYERLMSAGRDIANLEMLGPVNYEDVGPLFERARVHLNTSDSEGFPNTFLQAWIRSVPVVSFFDPDGLIQSQRLGRSCRDVDEMATAIGELLDDPEGCAATGRRAHAFVASEFSARQVATRYLELLDVAVAPPVSAHARVLAAGVERHAR